MFAIYAIESPFTVFESAYTQRGLLAVVLIAALAGAVGSAIVLRDLPFFTHAVGAGAYPFMVAGLAAGFALPVGALAGAAVFASVVTFVGRRTSDSGRRDAVIGLLVAAALAIGSVVAATAVGPESQLALPPEVLLFGSLFAVTPEVLMTALIVVLVLIPISLAFADRWIAAGFDPGVASRIGAGRSDLILMASIALAAAATLPLTGSLLAGALLVIPAATTRLFVDHKDALAPVTFAIALIEGVFGMYLSVVLDLPAGATIALVAATGFALVAAAVFLVGIARRNRAARSVAAATALLIAAFVISGCGGSDSDEPTTEDEPSAISVVATTPQVADLVEQVGGKAVSVKTVMPAGTDPHDFEPKPSDVAAMAEADVIFRSGGDLDGWVVAAAENADGPKPVDLSTSVVLIEGGHSHEDEEHAEEEDHAEEEEHSKDEAFNSHWYLSPANLGAATERVRDELVKAAPDSRESIRADADDFEARIASANKALTACVAKVPKADRSFVSGHDDFAYLADAFDLEVVSQLAETGQSEPSVRQLQESVDAAREGGAKAVVTSSGEASQLATQVADRLNVPLLELYADTLAKSGAPSTAVGAIEFNISELVDAMSGGEVECATAG